MFKSVCPIDRKYAHSHVCSMLDGYLKFGPIKRDGLLCGGINKNTAWEQCWMEPLPAMHPCQLSKIYSQVFPSDSGWKSKHYANSAMRWGPMALPFLFCQSEIVGMKNRTSFVFSHRGRCHASFVQLQLQAAATRQAPAGSTWRVRTQPGDSAI